MIAPRLTKAACGYPHMLLETGVFQWAEDGTQAAQHAWTRIMIFKGELSHGGKLTTKTEGGTKAYEVVFAMDKPKAEKELELKSRILGTPGVESILEWDWVQVSHTVNITGKALTSWGEVDIGGEISAL
jgi:hypothetical protein